MFIDEKVFEEDCIDLLSGKEIEIPKYQSLDRIFTKINLAIDEPLAVLIVYIIQIYMV